jgi:hypothetical protein
MSAFIQTLSATSPGVVWFVGHMHKFTSRTVNHLNTENMTATFVAVGRGFFVSLKYLVRQVLLRTVRAMCAILIAAHYKCGVSNGQVGGTTAYNAPMMHSFTPNAVALLTIGPKLFFLNWLERIRNESPFVACKDGAH